MSLSPQDYEKSTLGGNMNTSTDEIIEAALYAVAEKQKMGLDMEESVKRAKNELLSVWSKDMSEMETDIRSCLGRFT